MPELPEVEMCRSDLDHWATGRRLRRVIVADPGVVRPTLSTRPSEALPDGAAVLAGILEGQVAQQPVRAGKRIAWPFGKHAMALHLGMTGRWRLRDQEPRWGKLGLVFDGGPTVWFIDPRRFGCVSPHPVDGALALIRKGLGPDGLTAPPDGPALRARLVGRRAIKVALLDQAVVAGLGNIHVAEALWRSGIDPRRAASSLDDAEADRLAQAIPAQFRWALDAQGGDEELVYITDGGDNPFAVYGREHQDCRRCGGTVQRLPQGGRSTFWCPGCQA